MQTFNCPTCSGPLEYSREAGAVVRCPFCGQSVIVPERVHGSSTKAATPAVGSQTRRLLALPVLLIAVGMLGFFLLRPDPSPPVVPMPAPSPSPPSTPSPPAVPPPRPAPPAEAGFEVLLSFGEEGIGPGRFEDARHIALDGDGAIYVGEYSGGRVQRFDADGTFRTQWLVDTERPLRGLAADRGGIVYASQGGRIQRYQGATGEALGAWPLPDRFRSDGLYPAPDGGLLIVGSGAGPQEVVLFDAQGRVRLRVETQVHNPMAAVDGLGNIYVIGGFSERGKLHEAVFKYGPDGAFLNRFGGAGDEPGQFRAPHSIAIDGRGRVYVGDIKGLQVFDSDGRFLEQLKVGPTVFGMIFNDRDELFVVERNQHRVMKLRLTRAS